MKTIEPKLAAEVAAWLDRADAADQAEDAEHGADLRGDETPDWMADKQRRLERIRAAKAQREAEAAMDPTDFDPQGPGPSSGMRERGARKKPQDGAPAPPPPDKAQRNFTDGDNRIQPTRDGFIAGYNGQIAVDAEHQIIVALIPLVDQAEANLGRKLCEVSGDTGFSTEANIEAMHARNIRAYLPPGRARHGDDHAAGEWTLLKKPAMKAMAKKLRRGGRRSRYRLRKQTVEPVFGHIKQARAFRQFHLRGLEKVQGEWSLVCTAHNLLKLAGARA